MTRTDKEIRDEIRRVRDWYVNRTATTEDIYITQTSLLGSHIDENLTNQLKNGIISVIDSMTETLLRSFDD
jgi:hypothetical protein